MDSWPEDNFPTFSADGLFTFGLVSLAAFCSLPTFPASAPDLIPIFQQLPPVMLSIGLVWFVSGAVTLIWFIRHNPLPPTETP